MNSGRAVRGAGLRPSRKRSSGGAASASVPGRAPRPSVRVPPHAPAGASPARGLDLGPGRTFRLPDRCVVSTLCTQTRALLGLQLIEQFALLMVILFISLELSPWVCLHQRLAVRAAVFGQGITLMDGARGGGGLRAAERGGPGGSGEPAASGSTSDLGREGNVSARDRRPWPPAGGGWGARSRRPLPLSRLIPNSRRCRAAARTATSKRDLELPGPRRFDSPGWWRPRPPNPDYG